MFRDMVHEQIVDHERRRFYAPARVLARRLDREIRVAQAPQFVASAPHRFTDVSDDVFESMRRGVGDGGDARGVSVVAASFSAAAAPRVRGSGIVTVLTEQL